MSARQQNRCFHADAIATTVTRTFPRNRSGNRYPVLGEEDEVVLSELRSNRLELLRGAAGPAK